ncbi:MAG: hypothetical protein C0601_03895 [Candidatus Muiribacterium halophilum]|uniref:Phosphoribosyltransferase domain-containing protein n=1 Tax=Muiribacterium halophilum TaxID=2053465 RepID=A0A2N5ZJ59_MUIH1|nr:MAG: hypothetical protein C0601_03895 [Candidatus Muirbacterium halophilum]
MSPMKSSNLLRILKEVSFSKEIENLKNSLFDIFFPPSCVVCGKKIKRVLCDDCISIDSEFRKKLFNKINKRYGVNDLYYLSEYKGDFRKRLLVFKNSKNRNLLRDLSLAFVIKNQIKKDEFDLVTYVPGRKGLSFHSAGLAYKISQLVGGRFCKGLIIKKRQTSEMKTLGRKEREKEIKGAFRINPSFKIKKNSKILIIDDIITTGNTVSEITSLFADVKLSIGVLGVTPIEKRRKTEKNLAKKL